MIYKIKCQAPNCKEKLTLGVAEYSKRAYDLELCVVHQYEVRTGKLNLDTIERIEDKIERTNAKQRRDEKGEDLDGNTQKEMWGGF